MWRIFHSIKVPETHQYLLEHPIEAYVKVAMSGKEFSADQ